MSGRRLRIAALGATLLAVLALTFSLAAYELVRASWAEESALVGRETYSAARSDGLYAEVDAARRHARGAAWVAGIGLAFLAVTLGAARRPWRAERRTPSRARLVATTIVDGLASVCVLGSSALGGALGGSPALEDVMSIAPPFVPIAALAWLAAAGETPGSLLTRVELDTWPAARAPVVVAALFLSLALPFTALAAALGAGTGLLAPHLLALGAIRRAGANPKTQGGVRSRA